MQLPETSQETSQTERLDIYVARQLPKLSRSASATLITRGKVTVNGELVIKAGYKLRSTDTVSIDYAPASTSSQADLKMPILYEDKNCLVVDKPAGVLTHSKGAFNPEPAVATWLAKRAPEMTGERAGIVHRLDRATSGVMICAKTPQALSWLQKQFSLRKVKKVYTAVVKGAPAEQSAIIDMPIERNPRKPQTFRVGANGKSATTEYKLLASGNGYSMLELRPTTGRTHQLRVHLHKIGHPIVGDELYDGPKGQRLYLHATELEITLPDKVRKIFKSSVPSSFKELL